MSQVSGGTAIGSYFMKWKDEDKKGFVREHEGRLLVCTPSKYASPVQSNRLYLVEADCIDRTSAEYLLEHLKKKRGR